MHPIINLTDPVIDARMTVFLPFALSSPAAISRASAEVQGEPCLAMWHGLTRLPAGQIRECSWSGSPSVFESSFLTKATEQDSNRSHECAIIHTVPTLGKAAIKLPLSPPFLHARPSDGPGMARPVALEDWLSSRGLHRRGMASSSQLPSTRTHPWLDPSCNALDGAATEISR